MSIQSRWRERVRRSGGGAASEEEVSWRSPGISGMLTRFCSPFLSVASARCPGLGPRGLGLLP